MLEDWLKTWCWGHHCIDKEYGIDHGDCVYLSKGVLKCNTCDTSQIEQLFSRMGICDLDG